MTAGWTYEELLTNGWFPHWQPRHAGEPWVLEFTWYRSEIARHSVFASGATEEEAMTEAASLANAWLREHPGFQPKRPPATSRDS